MLAAMAAKCAVPLVNVASAPAEQVKRPCVARELAMGELAVV